jgi:trehalose utilization protein
LNPAIWYLTAVKQNAVLYKSGLEMQPNTSKLRTEILRFSPQSVHSMAGSPIRVTVWNEFRHEHHSETVRGLYPRGIHARLAEALQACAGIVTQTATLDEPEHGLTEAVLDSTDVLLWWGHMAHDEVAEEIVDRVQRRVLDGMGFMPLHSAHMSKPFLRLMGTTGNLRWREAGDSERLWVVNPAHPIAAGIGPHIFLEQAEMYGEFFDVPRPDETIFISWFEGGEVFRSGLTWIRGRGRVFYFRPGHETYPIYHHPEVLKVLENGVRWAAFRGSEAIQNCCVDSAVAENPIRPKN